MDNIEFAAWVLALAGVLALGYYLIPVFSPQLAKRLKISDTAEDEPNDRL